MAVSVRILSVFSTAFTAFPFDLIKKFPSWSNWKRILETSTHKITFSKSNARVIVGERTERQLFSTFAMKMSQFLTFQSINFEELATMRQFLVFQSDQDIIDHGIPISASCFNTGTRAVFTAQTMSRTHNQSDRPSDDKVWSRGLRHD